MLYVFVVKCGAGFEVQPLNAAQAPQGALFGVVRVECPHCKHAMCFKCQQHWRAEHKNKSREDFKLFLQVPGDPLAAHSPLVRAALEISVHSPALTLLLVLL